MDRDGRRKGRVTSAGFFVLPDDVSGDRITLRTEEAHHASHVCRCRTGDRIDATDGIGTFYRCRVSKISPDLLQAEILERLPEHGEPRILLVLAVPPLKGERFDWLVEKAVEVGAGKIIPISTERTVVEADHRRDRWMRVALSATKQARRSRLTEISEVRPYPEALSELAGQVDLVLLACEDPEDSDDLRKGFSSAAVSSLGILVGPEGGFTRKEIDAARSIGARPFSLGPQRLRTETAGVVAVALALNEFRKFDSLEGPTS